MANRRNVIQQFGDYGGWWTGLAATATGSGNDVVADFTGSTQDLFEGVPSRVDPATPAIVAVHSAVNGSTFKVPLQGQYQAFALVQTQTAASVLAAIGLDNVVGDLTIDPPVISGAPLRYLTRALRIAAAADSDPVLLTSRPFIVTRAMAFDPLLGILRLLLSNNAGAGAADATLLVAACSFGVFRIGEIPAYLSERD